MLARFRDWLFACIRRSGVRARSHARLAEWLNSSPPRRTDFVSELRRVVKETGAHVVNGSGTSEARQATKPKFSPQKERPDTSASL
jgi:hypothetical protein